MSTPATENFEQIAARVDQAIAAVQGLESEARDKANTLRSSIEAFHKEGLRRMVESLKADPRGKQLLLEMAAEPSVYALFAMHNLIRADLPTRVSRVIEMVRPHVQSQGGDVELGSVQGRVVFIKLTGAKGCSSTAAQLRSGVEDAIREQVPDIERIEVMPNEPVAEVLVQIGSTPPTDEPGWIKGPATSELLNAKPFRWDVGDYSILLLRFDGMLQAFRNACAHQGLPLDGGQVDVEAKTITCPWHGFRFDCQTGECLTAPQAQLQTLPVQIKNGFAWVRPQ